MSNDPSRKDRHQNVKLCRLPKDPALGSSSLAIVPRPERELSSQLSSQSSKTPNNFDIYLPQRSAVSDSCLITENAVKSIQKALAEETARLLAKKKAWERSVERMGLSIKEAEEEAALRSNHLALFGNEIDGIKSAYSKPQVQPTINEELEALDKKRQEKQRCLAELAKARDFKALRTS